MQQGASNQDHCESIRGTLKDAFRQLARKNGSLAKQKAQRMTALLQTPPGDPLSHDWPRQEARELSRAVEYHLRQASLIGHTICSLETE